MVPNCVLDGGAYGTEQVVEHGGERRRAVHTHACYLVIAVAAADHRSDGEFTEAMTDPATP